MLWLLRLWLYAVILGLGWAMICYGLTRNPHYLTRARQILRASLWLMAAIAVLWLLWRLLR